MKKSSILWLWLVGLLAEPRLFLVASPAQTSPSNSTAAGNPEREVDFNTEIKPILASRCYECHGTEKSKSGLRLDRRDLAWRGGDSGSAILPGNSKASLLIHYVTGDNEDKIVMPAQGERLREDQIALLKRWIDQGAPWPEEPSPSTLHSQPSTPSHWAFQPPRRQAIPLGKTPSRVRNPIDAFVLSRLEKEGIAPAAEADRFTLFHRLSLDLVGFPLSVEEFEILSKDGSAEAYENLVDRLLASPHFGERWGRHWLDLARYADSDGYEDDKFRPDAWRYRDWVIDAFNRDLPFDQFTLLQLAGDLLPDATYEQKLATGFHRMTLSNNAGAGGVKEEYRVKTVKDRLNTTGTVWLGLTVGCAECHSHKYDPISQREYYEFYAFFNNTEESNAPAPAMPAHYVREYEEALRAFNERNRKLQNAVRDYERDVLPSKQQQWEKLAKDDPDLPEAIRLALAVPADQRTAAQRQELAKYFRSIDPEYGRLKAALPVGDEVGNNRPLPPSAKALIVAENANPRKSFFQKKGDFLRHGAEVHPGAPAFLPPLKPRGGRPDRLDLARWIVDPNHPLTARVAVNHLWQHLFGQGLVVTADNFGIKGDPPSHPELLDWLATEFVARGWSRKAMIRLIVMSSTYRQSSRFRPELAGKDPINTWIARQNRFRLEAECVRDAALAASGLLRREVGGPSFQPPLPVAFAQAKELKNERFMEPTVGASKYRRGAYVNVQRTFPFPTFTTFDVSDANVCTVRRERSNTPLQALTLLNDPVYFEAAQALGGRALRECRGDFDARMRLLYRAALSRPAQPDEIAEMKSLYAELLSLCRSNSEAAGAMIGEQSLPDATDPCEAAAWIGLARAVLNLDEFTTRQ